MGYERTYQAVRMRASKLGVHYMPHQRTSPEAQDKAQFIVDHYATMPNAELAETLKLPLATLYPWLRQLAAEGRIVLKRPRSVSKTQLAYLAGVFDSGASFQVRRRASHFDVRVVVTMPNPAIADLFHATLGGVRERGRNRLAWYALGTIRTLLTRLQPYSRHPKLAAMLAFIDDPSDERMQAVTE